MERKHENVRRRITSILAAAALALAGGGTALAGTPGAAKQSWQGQSRDAWVDGKIEASYALSRYLNPFDIDTHVEKGVVRLTGTVESQIDKDLAEQIAMGVDGVEEVQNDLVVKAGTRKEGPVKRAAQDFGRRVEDATTTARVKFALLANKSADGLKIDVDTENGVVALEGSVASKQERALAEQIAENTEGVKNVENHLKVGEQS